MIEKPVGRGVDVSVLNLKEIACSTLVMVMLGFIDLDLYEHRLNIIRLSGAVTRKGDVLHLFASSATSSILQS